MDKVKEFITDFFLSEAITRYNRTKPDIDKYNQSLSKMNNFLDPSLVGFMGVLEMNKLKDDSYYKKREYIKSMNHRHLFKISHYESSTYGDVWVCYCSGTNPDIDFPFLSVALFVIKEEGEYKVARNYLYSDQGGMSTEYRWEGFSGLQDLTFESLGELYGVERYLEPVDIDDDGAKLYHQDA